jgi:hypothetical protein
LVSFIAALYAGRAHGSKSGNFGVSGACALGHSISAPGARMSGAVIGRIGESELFALNHMLSVVIGIAD